MGTSQGDPSCNADNSDGRNKDLGRTAALLTKTLQRQTVWSSCNGYRSEA
jgi:hypothetical protein